MKQSNVNDHYTFSTDATSMLIQNIQLLEKLNPSQLQSLQNDIINHVFGGFQSLCNFLFKPTIKIITIEMQHKLHQLLTNTVEEDPIPSTLLKVTDLPNDCLSYMMRFLSPTERATIQICNRHLAITARQESSVNDIEKELPMMNMMPYKSTIINKILSNDEDENVDGVKLYAKYRLKNYGCFSWANNKVLAHYGKDLHDKYKQILMDNITNPEITCIVADNFADLMKNENIHKYLPSLIDTFIINDNGQQLSNMIRTISNGIKYDDRFITKCLKINGFIPSLFTVLKKTKSLTGKDFAQNHVNMSTFTRSNLMFATSELLSDIFLFINNEHYQSIMNNDNIFDTLYEVIMTQQSQNAHPVGYRYDKHAVCNVLKGFVENAKEEDIDKLLDHALIQDSNAFGKTMLYSLPQMPFHLQQFVLVLIEKCNKKQRLKAIDAMVGPSELNSYQGQNRFEDRLRNLIQELNDTEAMSKLQTVSITTLNQTAPVSIPVHAMTLPNIPLTNLNDYS